MDAASANIVGKVGLAAALGWARTTLDRRLKDDPVFPVVERGDRSGGWKFDVDQVRRHVSKLTRGVGRPGRADDRKPSQRDRNSRSNSGTGTTVGKRDLCAVLGWARSKLDHRLKTDPGFPCVRKGDQSGGWEFDPAAVRAHLAGRPSIAARALDSVQLKDTIAPARQRSSPEPRASHARSSAPTRRSADHKGEATARQRKDGAQADMIELKLGVERGRYVDVEHMRQCVTMLVVHFAKALDVMPENLARDLELPDTAVSAIRKFMDDVRTQLHRDVSETFREPDAAAQKHGAENGTDI